MKRFARLFADIDQTNSTNRKVDAMALYFAATMNDADTNANLVQQRKLFGE